MLKIYLFLFYYFINKRVNGFNVISTCCICLSLIARFYFHICVPLIFKVIIFVSFVSELNCSLEQFFVYWKLIKQLDHFYEIVMLIIKSGMEDTEIKYCELSREPRLFLRGKRSRNWKEEDRIKLLRKLSKALTSHW